MSRKAREALRKLNHAFEYLRLRMQGDTIQGIPPNAEALAGSILAAAMVRVVMSARKDGE